LIFPSVIHAPRTLAMEKWIAMPSSRTVEFINARPMPDCSRPNASESAWPCSLNVRSGFSSV
jgi:hypothetical protein